MKKFLVSLFALLSVFSAKAFVFDGIDLNGSVVQVTREVAAKGYIFDIEKQCLKGTCQGTEIYLTFNTEDTKEKNKIGQLIVEIPMAANDAEASQAYKNVTMLFNVIYHQLSNANGVATYSVDADGTTLDVKAKGNSVILTYNTPAYKGKK